MAKSGVSFLTPPLPPRPQFVEICSSTGPYVFSLSLDVCVLVMIYSAEFLEVLMLCWCSVCDSDLK